MKYLLSILLVSMTGFAGCYSQNLADGTVRKVLLTLQEKEFIVATESSLPLNIAGGNLFLVTRLEKEFYVYEGDKRKGPYENLENVEIKPCETDRYGVECSVFSGPEAGKGNELMAMNEEGKFIVNFKGKEYGPVQYLSQVFAWPDQSGFVAIGMDKTMKAVLLTSEGINMPLDGSVEKLHTSPEGKNYVFVLKENPELNNPLLTMDLSTITPEEIIKIVQEQEVKNSAAGPPKAYIYSYKKMKLGPFDAKEFSNNNPAFTKTGGDNWFMIMNNTLYINGDLKQKFEDFRLYPCRIWLSKDGERYAVVSDNHILFSDGISYPFPIKIDSVEKDGKVFMVWISLEDNKDLVHYTREL